MPEKDQQNQEDSKKKRSPLTDFFRDALSPHWRAKRFSAHYANLDIELEEVLNILRPDLPSKLYQEIFDDGNLKGEYEFCLDIECDWIIENNLPITRDVFDRLKHIGDLMALERAKMWELLKLNVTD